MATKTTDQSYFTAIQPKITFKSIDEADTYFVFDPLNGSTGGINVGYMDVESNAGETGTTNIIIDDSDNIVNKDHLRNTKVFIEMGKTAATLQSYFIAYADIFNVERPRTHHQEYHITGLGTASYATDLLLLIRQASKSDNDPEFTVKRLFKRALEERKFRPLNRGDIEGITGWTETNIADNLNTNYPVLNEEFSTLADFYDRLSALEGCNWYIDYRTGQEVLTAKHPTANSSGKIIKSGDLRTPSDRADKVSYIKGPFNVTYDSTASAGVRTRLYTTTFIENEIISESIPDKAGTTLNQRFIAQQVNILNDQRRITDLRFRMNKIGEPDSPKGRLNGFIIMDEENKPTGTILGKFHIDISSVENDNEPIFVNDVDIKSRFLEGGSKIWIVFTDRSGIKGDVENDPANTVAWKHDNAVNVAHTAGTYSATATADANFRDDPTKASWQVSTNGPVYTYAIMSTIKRLQARSNYSAIKQLRDKEAFIDSSFLKTPKSVNRFLSLNLNPMSKPRVTISNLRVTVPNNFLYRPYETVTFADALSDIFTDLQITGTRYVISGQSGGPQLGTYDVELTLNGSFNSLLGSCSCL